MIKFLKKFLVFERNNKSGLIKDEDINSISDEEAREFMNKLPVESLLDLNRPENQIYLQKGLFGQINGFIACVGRPGQGKSSLCSAFYKVLYGLNREIFSISNSALSFTKGLWILKDRERRNIKQNIFKEIIDVEGFQVDEVSTWKYIMIVAFISTDIIIVNRDRMDDVKKILSIIWNSLEKMKKLGLPKLLKAIWVQLDDEDKISTFQDIMNLIGNSSEKWNDKGIKLYPILIELVDKKEYKKAKGNILECESYLEQVKTVFEQVQGVNISESVSTLLTHIDNFNNTLNGKDTFNMDNIKDELKKDFETAYSTVKIKKENKLRQDYNLEKFQEPNNSNETFDDFIKRHTQIDFKFSEDDVKEKLSFYKSSDAFDKIYDEMIGQKDFKADPNIFKPIYDTLIEKVRCKEQMEIEREKLKKQKLEEEERIKREKELLKKERQKQQAYEDYEKKKIEIKKYFANLQFYDDIDSFWDYKYNINGDYDNETKNDYNKKLKNFYYEQEKNKRNEWENQIKRSINRCAIQCYGDMRCKSGHNFKDPNVGCASCEEKGIEYEKRLLYWVDGDAHYGICKYCERVRKISETVICSCGAECECKIKWNKGYRP